MNKFKKILILSLIIIGAVSILHLTSTGRHIENTLRRVYVWVAFVGYNSRAYAAKTPTSQKTVDAEILRAEVERLRKEQAELRKLLTFKEETSFKIIGAVIRGRSSDPSRSNIIINRGNEDGIIVGLPVVAENGVLVGVIGEVYDGYSMIRLLTDPQSRIAGRLLNDAQVEGVIAGGHGIIVRMELVPRSEKIDIGTQLVTSGLDSQIPRGLLIGNVLSLEQDTNTLFQRVIIETPIDYSTLQFVAVLISG